MNRYPVGQCEKAILYKKHDGHCAYCGKKITREEMRLAWHIPGKMAGHAVYLIFSLPVFPAVCIKGISQ